MKHLGLFAVLTLFSLEVMAAKFTPIKTVSSASALKLGSVVSKIIQNEGIFGEAGRVLAFSFVRKSTETNANTIKQLSFTKGGANIDDTQVSFKNVRADKITAFAFAAVEVQESDFESEFKTAKAAVYKAIKAIQADPKLEIYGSGHADENGSWQILYILDTTTNQVLLVKIGYYGT